MTHGLSKVPSCCVGAAFLSAVVEMLRPVPVSSVATRYAIRVFPARAWQGQG